MAEQKITKKYKNKNGEVKETTYRIDADFVPKKATDICDEFINNYCKAQGVEAVKWLLGKRKEKVIATKEKTNLETNEIETIEFERKLTALEIRKAFIEKFLTIIFLTYI